MKIKEEVIDAIVDHIMKMELPNVDVIGAHISTPEIIDEEEQICKVPIEIHLQSKRIEIGKNLMF